jgi:hypothetical protein
MHESMAYTEIMNREVRSMGNVGCRALRMAVAAMVLMTGAGTGCGSEEAQAEYDTVTSACVAGSYLVDEGSGTRSLWTFFRDGNFTGTSSAQPALKFGDQHGTWKLTEGNGIRVTYFDFSFDDQGSLINIARIDASLIIDRTCRQLDGSFTLRFFEDGEDPFVPASDTGTPITDTVTGHQIETE